MSLLAVLEQSVHENGGLIVSCQPVPCSPMDKPEIVAAMAQAAASAGAVAVRIEGIENLRTVRPHLSVPIIGIIKRDLTGSPVRITPIYRMLTPWRRQVPILSLLMPHSALARLILIVY